jgi:dGTPase
VDDGLRSGLLSFEQLTGVELFARHRVEVVSRYPALDQRRLVHETVRHLVNTLVTDLIGHSRESIAMAAIVSADEARRAPALVAFSAAIAREQQGLKDFLRAHLYRHVQVDRMTSKARRIVEELFEAFSGDPRLLPPEFQERARRDGARAMADYIAGMTDRYAIREHRRLHGIDEV